MQEIFNKVDQNQLRRTKKVVYFLDATKFSRKRLQESRNDLWDSTHCEIRGGMVDDRVIHAKEGNSHDTSIKPEMSSE